MALMLAGNVGIVTAIASLMNGVLRTADAEEVTLRALLLVGGLLSVYLLAQSEAVDRRLTDWSSRVLNRYTDLDVRDYAGLLHVAGEYSVKELLARPGGWLAGRTLGDLRLRDEGVTVLGIVRQDDSYEGAPGKNTVIQGG